MKKPGTYRLLSLQVILFLLVISLLASGCSSLFSSPAPGDDTDESPPAETPPSSREAAPRAEVTFQLNLPPDSSGDDTTYINLLDEVTGLALNVESHAMQTLDKTHTRVTLPLPVGAVVKYRYSRQPAEGGSPVDEHMVDGRQVRYRLMHVTGPGEIIDSVARWTDSEFHGETGRIYGTILDNTSGYPLPNILVSAAGKQTLTSALGEYLLEDLPVGTHNLVAYALDGRYPTFQQGARVDAGTGTPAHLRLEAAPMVRVTFEVAVPANTLPAAPIRLAGNLYQLGNSFGDLAAGFNLTAARLPQLVLQPGGGYRLELTLPAGADVRYLFTQGDGFWSAERSLQGAPILRRLIVPSADTVIQVQVASWASPAGAAPILFDVRLPADTPPDEAIYIQFNPLIGWTEPLPMWPLGENRWIFALTGPLGLEESLKYRLCRGTACGTADDIQTHGPGAAGLPAVPAEGESAIRYTVPAWAWPPSEAAQDLPAPETIAPRSPGFVTGFELQPRWHPAWTASRAEDLVAVRAQGAGWVVLTPSWSYQAVAYPLLEPVPGADPLWSDLTAYTASAQALGLEVALFPGVDFPSPIEAWWQAGRRDFGWWVVWFEQYRQFILHHAELAGQSGASALILGGDWLAPALPPGVLADGSPANLPAEMSANWVKLLAEVRLYYTGPVWWALPDSQALQSPPPFLQELDGIYVLVSEPLVDLAAGENPEDPAVMAVGAARLLENLVLPLQLAYEKPVILAAAYPALDGIAGGLAPGGAPLPDWHVIQPPGGIGPDREPDLVEQAAVYAALLDAVNQRPWIGGFISRGYYPGVRLGDPSAAVRGKPAGNILSFWFKTWMGE